MIINYKKMLISRVYQNLNNYLETNKALVIYGPRQVGKTTLITDFTEKTSLKYKLDSGDDIKVRQIIGSENIKLITEYLSGYELYIIDEAQKIPQVGLGLKIITDHIPNIKIIATGSSSFELSGQIGEPLTGRKNLITLYPLAQTELLKLYNNHEIKEKLPDFLIHGSYPEIITQNDKAKKENRLNELVNSYILKDILELERIKGSAVLLDLLRLIAFQIGGEVSLNELGRSLGLDSKTINRYLDLLEKSFIIFKLRAYSGNLRKEISKKSKYYFWDNGIRNAIISNFNSLENRDDSGKLWENFLVLERLKLQSYTPIYANNFFWRTWDKQEIDWLEERAGKLFAYEFKFTQSKYKEPKIFKEKYPNSQFELINQDNYLDFLKMS